MAFQKPTLYQKWKAESANSAKWASFVSDGNEKILRNKVVERYITINSSKQLNKEQQNIFNEILNVDKDYTNEQMYMMANYLWFNMTASQIDNLLRTAADETDTTQKSNASSINPGKMSDTVETTKDSTPFDRRLDRLEYFTKSDGMSGSTIIPFDSRQADITTVGHIMSSKTLQNLPANTPNKNKWIEARERQYKSMQNDDFYKGVPALQNAYALVNLYGSKAGKLLMNQKGQRRWYEVDSDKEYNFASTPTTSALIGWGNGDPYGRTPYFFTDFVFAKYWKKIENNRLITLRRYPAPIYDNLKYPGMTGSNDAGDSIETKIGDSGSSKGESSLPPMASAITYFGGETGNSLNNLLKFMTGYEWGEVQADVWNVTTDTVPNNKTGLGQLFGGGVGNMAEMLNVAAGNFSPEYIANKGILPPDPYVDGPYENRIQGPVNRIDKVMKRNPGLKFQMDNLKLVFEYVARPVGGINPKAVLLDILSNFLIIGSASAVFFGGAHRFMIDPAKYPFIGGEKSIQKLYKGDPIGYSLDAIKSFAGEGGVGQGAMDNLLKSIQGMWNQILSGDKGSFFGTITAGSSGGIGNLIKNEIAKKTAGQVPYLKGMRSILTGEPVGEWHVTIGNPLNPIAMIGNLICDNIEVEFNDELGPDDFPTEIKITVNLKHGMGRDKDAIESIFNRGMGRIYNLPDSFLGSGDYQTSIDSATQNKDNIGRMEGGATGIIYSKGMDSRGIPLSEVKRNDLKTQGSPSIWDRAAFKIGISENSDITRQQNEILKSAYRTADWVAQRTLI